MPNDKTHLRFFTIILGRNTTCFEVDQRNLCTFTHERLILKNVNRAHDDNSIVQRTITSNLEVLPQRVAGLQFLVL